MPWFPTLIESFSSLLQWYGGRARHKRSCARAAVSRAVIPRRMHLPVRRSGKADEEPCGAVWSTGLLGSSPGASLATGPPPPGESCRASLDEAEGKSEFQTKDSRFAHVHVILARNPGSLPGLQIFCELGFGTQTCQASLRAPRAPRLAPCSESVWQPAFFM